LAQLPAHSFGSCSKPNSAGGRSQKIEILLAATLRYLDGKSVDAILSDIEGNLEALQAVLDSAHDNQAERIICLGDIVGYGPNPVECAELLKASDVYIASEWDIAAAADDDPEWPPSMLRKLAWVRKQFSPYPELLKFLRSGKQLHANEHKTYFHGTPQRRMDFIFPEDIYIPGKLDHVLENVSPIAFCGNSHVPGLFHKDPEWDFQAPEVFSDRWINLRDVRKPCLCNVGSVGQPRDGDRRACYVLNEGERIRFMRIEYDSEKTRQKIRDNPDQDDNDGDRLNWGR